MEPVVAGEFALVDVGAGDDGNLDFAFAGCHCSLVVLDGCEPGEGRDGFADPPGAVGENEDGVVTGPGVEGVLDETAEAGVAAAAR